MQHALLPSLQRHACPDQLFAEPDKSLQSAHGLLPMSYLPPSKSDHRVRLTCVMFFLAMHGSFLYSTNKFDQVFDHFFFKGQCSPEAPNVVLYISQNHSVIRCSDASQILCQLGMGSWSVSQDYQGTFNPRFDTVAVDFRYIDKKW